MNKRKELIQAYKQTPTPMGVYQIRNRNNGKCLIGSSMNVPGKFNNLSFQLRSNSHRCKELQREWNEQGAAAFAFEVLEMLNPDKVLQEEWPKALAALEEKWLQTVKPYGSKGYHPEKTH